MTDDDIRRQLSRFLAAHAGDHKLVISNLRRIGVGRSRQNWVFDLASGDGDVPNVESLILRRDPDGGLVDTDRAVEFEVLRALTASDLRTPMPRWLDATGEWLGKPSLIMRREPGACDYGLLNGDLPLEQRVRYAALLCGLLHQVHAVDWRALGLAQVFDDPGPEAACSELHAWINVLRRDQLEPFPELEFGIAWLRDNAPRSERTVLVHADFKPGNVLVRDGDVTALLDWELAHLGDPLEDLGWVTQPLRGREHLIAGHWERKDLVAEYERLDGRPVDPEALAWWQAFSTFKTAVMQVTGLRAFLEGRSDEPYRPARRVLTTLLHQTGAGED